MVAEVGEVGFGVGGGRAERLAVMAGTVVQRVDGADGVLQPGDPHEVEQGWLLPGVAAGSVPVS